MMIWMGCKLELVREILKGLGSVKDSEGELKFLSLDRVKKSRETF
jgi:hypothetical protein